MSELVKFGIFYSNMTLFKDFDCDRIPNAQVI